MLTPRITMLFAALLTAAPAAAQVNRNVSLNWVRAPEADGCTSAKSVAQRVQSYFESDHLLSEERFQFVSSGSAHIAIEALVTPYQDGWQVAIGLSRDDVRVPGTEFVQRSRSCDQLEVQAALVISQLLDSPRFAQEPVAAETHSAPVMAAVYVVDVESAPSPVAPEPRRSAVTAEARASEAMRLRLMTGGLIDRGIFPGSGLGARVGIAFESPQVFPIELHAAFSASDGEGQFPNQRAGITPSASALLHAGTLTVLACPASWMAGRFGVSGCAGFAGSAVNAQLRDFRRNDSAWVSWLGLEVAVRPMFEISNAFGLWLEASASFTLLSSDDFVADLSDSASDRLTLYSAPQQTAQLALGVFYLL